MAARRGDQKLRSAIAARQYRGLTSEMRLIYAPCERCGECTDMPCSGCLFRGQFNGVRNQHPWAVCSYCLADKLLCSECTEDGYTTRTCRKLLKRLYPTVYKEQDVLVTATVEDGKVVRPYSPRVIPIEQGEWVHVEHWYPNGAGIQETEIQRAPTVLERSSRRCPSPATGSISFCGPDF